MRRIESASLHLKGRTYDAELLLKSFLQTTIGGGFRVLVLKLQQ